MQTTSEILTALAPEFVELDEAEKSAFPAPWEWNNYQRAFYRCTPGRMQLASLVTYNENTKFVQAARNQTRALLDAYAQALAKLAEQEWQPIETAPKDGRTILGWSKYMSEPCTIRWGKIYKRFSATLEGWASCWDGAEVIKSEHDFGTDYKDPEPVTHWLPLPLPPQESDA